MTQDKVVVNRISTTDEPKLLRVPERMSVEQLLAVAGKMGLTNAVLLSQRENGHIVLLDADNGSGMTVAQVNWLLDGAKFHIQSVCSKVETLDG